jgi:hypothetical protein
MMTYTTVESSMIDLVGYDEETSTLEARFVNTGYTYRYENVPKEEYEGLMEASSKGSYFREIIECYSGFKVKGGRRR